MTDDDRDDGLMPDHFDFEWSEKSAPDELYRVVITLESNGRSPFVSLETRRSKGAIMPDFALMTDLARGRIAPIDAFPFATLLQLEDATCRMEMKRELGLPMTNYDPSVYPAAFVMAAQIMSHVQQILSMALPDEQF